MNAKVSIEQRFWRIGNPVLWGIGFSFVLVAAFAWMFSLEDCGLTSCETKWHKFIASSPNEMGDALAGLAGALAFLWIIVTVMLQSQELREQRKELRLQRDEFEKMREAQELQAETLQTQAEIFRDEQRQRNELKAKELVEIKLVGLAKLIVEFEENGPRWEYFTPTDAGGGTRGSEMIFPFQEIGESLEEKFGYREQEASLAKNRLSLLYDRNELTKKPIFQDWYHNLLSEIDSITELKQSLAPAQIEWFRQLNIQNLQDDIREIFEMNIWQNKKSVEDEP